MTEEDWGWLKKVVNQERRRAYLPVIYGGSAVMEGFDDGDGMGGTEKPPFFPVDSKR